MLEEYLKRNDFLLADGQGYRKIALKHQVNNNWWHITYESDIQNIGDMLSDVVFDYMCGLYGLDAKKKIDKTKHLYSIGSIIFFGNQDATVWGSGSLRNPNYTYKFLIHQRYMRKLDVRAVRGPMTREILLKLGIKCPEIYGDPAVLMPLIYQPQKKIGNKIVLIKHYRDQKTCVKNKNSVVETNMLGSDWKSKIDLIASAKCVISSSLHGLILAESYGVPAIFLKQENNRDTFKYADYYKGTGRNGFLAADSLEEALQMDPFRNEILELKQVQNRLINAFPVDLWD